MQSRQERACGRVVILVVLSLAMLPAAAALSPMPTVTLTGAFSAPEVAPGAIDLTVTFQNNGGPQTFFSHVEAGERHYDPFTVELTYPTPSREGCAAGRAGSKTRRLVFVDDRDKSAPVTAKLEAGESFAHVLDLDDWARRKVNGALPLSPGWYKVVVKYDGASYGSSGGVWTGKAGSPEIRLTVTGKPTGGMCSKNPGWDTW